MDHYLSKPIRPRDLEKAIRESIAAQKRSRSAEDGADGVPASRSRAGAPARPRRGRGGGGGVGLSGLQQSPSLDCNPHHDTTPSDSDTTTSYVSDASGTSSRRSGPEDRDTGSPPSDPAPKGTHGRRTLGRSPSASVRTQGSRGRAARVLAGAHRGQPLQQRQGQAGAGTAAPESDTSGEESTGEAEQGDCSQGRVMRQAHREYTVQGARRPSSGLGDLVGAREEPGVSRGQGEGSGTPLPGLEGLGGDEPGLHYQSTSSGREQEREGEGRGRGRGRGRMREIVRALGPQRGSAWGAPTPAP